LKQIWSDRDDSINEADDYEAAIELRSMESISEIDCPDTLELYFMDEEDFLDAKALLSNHCFIAHPALDADYRFSEIIG